MKLRSQWRFLLLVAVVMLLLPAQVSRAQDNMKARRLKNPATVRGFIGGESQDRYVVRARRGRTMTVRISWRKEEDNTASFSVSPVGDSDSEPLQGHESDNGKRWSARVPKTGDYIISVVAHPTAHYTLRVTVK
jgi:hypothetical protein